MAKTEAEKAAKQAAKAAEAEAAAKAERKAAKAAAKAAPAAAAEPVKAGKSKGGKSKGGGDDTFAGVGESGDLFSAKNYGPGTFLLFYPHRIDTNVVTSYGTEPEVPVGKVVVLDPKHPAKPIALFPSSPVFGKALLTGLRRSFEAGKPTAAVLQQAQFKGGEGWVLEPSADAEAAAKAYIAAAAAELLA